MYKYVSRFAQCTLVLLGDTVTMSPVVEHIIETALLHENVLP